MIPDSVSTLHFDSIESAHEYVALLCQAVEQAAQTIEQETLEPSDLTRPRHLDALRLIDYKLKSLRQHLETSSRVLTDLRTLRRYLLDERALDRASTQTADTAR